MSWNKNQWGEFITELQGQGLSPEEIQARIDQKKQELATGKQTGVAGEAATVAPDDVAAATGLASGTSLSESPSLAAPLQAPVAQEINDPIKQTSLSPNMFLEEQAKSLYNQKTGNINSFVKDYNKRTDDIRKGKITREQIADENYRREKYKSQDYDIAYNNFKKNYDKTNALPIAQKYKQETGSSLFTPTPNDADYASYAKTAVNNTLNNLPSNANLEDNETLDAVHSASIQELHDNDKVLQQDIIPGVIENIVMPKVEIEKKKLEEKYNLNSNNFNITDYEKANKEINDFFIKTFNTEIGSNPEYAERFKKYNEAVNNELQKNLTEAGRERLGLDEKTSLGETAEKTIKSIGNSMRGSLVASLTETRLQNDIKIERYEKMLESGEMTEDSFVTVGGSVSPKSGVMIGGKKMKVKDAIIRLQKDNIRIKDENLGRLKNYFDIQGDLEFYKDAIQDIESSSSFTEFIGKVFTNTPNLIVEQLPQLALALSGVGVFAQELGPAYFDTIYAQMDKDGIEHSEENFIKYLEEGKGDFAIAAGSASIQQLLESIGGATIAGAMYKNIGKTQVMSLMRLGMKDWAKSGGYKALVAGGKKSALTEFLTEGFQTATNQIAKGLSIGESGKYIDTNEIFKSAAVGGYIGWILPFGGNVARQSVSDISGIAAKINAIENPDASLYILGNMNKEIKLAEAQNKITPLESSNKAQAIVDVINANEKIRKEITGEDKVRAVELQVEKQQIENEIESLDKDVDKSDLETRKGEIIGEMNEIQKQALGKLSTAGARKIAEAEGVGFKEFDSTKETKNFIKEERAKGNKDIDITQSENYGFIIQNRKTGEQTIVLNKEEAQKDNVVTTAAHELLHGVLRNTLTSSEIQTKLGSELATELGNMDISNITNSEYANRLGQYLARAKERGGTAKEMGNAWEEGITLLSEGLLTGDIKYNETIATKIGDLIRRAFSIMGIKTKFNKGKHVFNFVKDYNKSLVAGKLTAGQQKVMAEGASGALIQSAKLEQTIQEEVKPSAVQESRSFNDLTIEEMIERHDHTYQYSDDRKNFDRGRRQEEIIDNKIKELGGWTQELVNTWNKSAPKDMAIDFQDLTIEERGGPLTDKDKETRLKEARRIIEVKSSLKIPEISKENKKTAAKNQELITIIKDEKSGISEKQRAENELYDNNQGTFRDIINKNFNRQLDTNMEENDLRSQLNETFTDAVRTWTPNKGAEFGAWFRILVNKKLPGAYKIVESKIDKETGKRVPITKRPIEDYKEEGGVTVQKDPDLKDKENIKRKLFTKKLGFDKIIIPGEFKIDKGGKQVPKTFADVFVDAVAKTFGTKLPSLSNIKEFKKDFIKKNRAELTPFIQNLTRIEKIKDKDGNVIKEIDHFKQFIDKNFDAIIKQLPLSVINKKYPMLRDAIVDETGKRRREPTKQGNPMFKKIQQEKADFLNHFTSRELKSATRSDRKQSLLRTIVDELSADAALEVTKDKTIMQKFKDVQEIEGQVVPENFIEKIVKELDRSLDNLNKLDVKSSLKFKSSKLALNTIKNSIKSGDGLIQARGKAIRAIQEEYGHQGINADIAESYKENIVITKSSIKIHNKGFLNTNEMLEYENITGQLGIEEKIGDLVAYKNERGGAIKVLEKEGVPAIINKFGDKAPLILWSLGRASFANSSTFGKDKFILFKGEPGYTKWFRSLAKNPKYGEVFKKYKNLSSKELNTLARKELGYTKERGSGIRFSNLVKEINPKTGKRKFNIQADKKRAADAMGLYDAIMQAASKNAKDSKSPESKKALAIIAKVITEPTNSLGKLAAPVLYEMENITKYKGRVKGEHLTPAAYLNAKMIEYYYNGNTDINIEKIKSDYSVALIPKDLSTIIDKYGPEGANLKELQHPSYKNGEGHPTVRIFNNDVLEVTKGTKFENIKLLDLTELTTKNPEQKTYTHGGTEVKSSLKPKEITKRVNEIIEDLKGIDATKDVTIEEAIQWGKKNRQLQWWIPTAAEDLRGLIYRLVRKGKDGEADLEFYDEALFKPLNLAYSEFLQKKQKAMEDMSAVRKEISDRGIDLQAEAFDGLTNDQVIRIYLWTKRGYDLTKLVSKDAVEQKTINKVMNYVRGLKAMDLLGAGGKLEQIYAKIDPETNEMVAHYPKPPENWRSGGILYDLFDRYNKVERSEIFQPFFDNLEALFGEFKNGKLTGKQANRLEAALGSHWVWVMEDMIARLKSGRNRSYGNDKNLNNALDWTNAAVATTMFVNSRSVTLQLISHLNFMNLSDNNVIDVGKAYASKDFIKTFLEIFNSDYLLQRRAGLKIDVNLDELSRAAEGQDQASKFNAIVSALLKKGFYPTQIADSAAIAFGGAPFLINRTKTYIKQGMSKKKAHEQAFMDFMEISETTQQASRPDKISMQQASSIGKLILAFQNTPMQYARIQRRAIQDFFAGRGNKLKHAGKIIHYGILQNILFHTMQKAIFALAFQDEANDEEEEKRLIMTANGIADTFLAGSGYYGMIAAMGKNVILELIDEFSEGGGKDTREALVRSTAFSPPINAKLRNLNNAMKRWEYKDNREMWDELSIDNPILRSGAELTEVVLNVPANRVVNKLENIMDATNKDTEYWRKMFLMMGWSSWDLMMEDYQHEPALKLKGMKSPRKIKTRTIKKRKIG